MNGECETIEQAEVVAIGEPVLGKNATVTYFDEDTDVPLVVEGGQ